MVAYWLRDPSPRSLHGDILPQIDTGRIKGIILPQDHKWSTEDLKETIDHGGEIVLLMRYKKQSEKDIVAEAKALLEDIGSTAASAGITADESGIKAMEHLASEGISVWATPLFSPSGALALAQKLDAVLAAGSKARLYVPVYPYDEHLNDLLKSSGLAQNRIGFFVATKIYNQIQASGISSVEVVFGDIDSVPDGAEKDYYVQNLHFEDAQIAMGMDLYKIVSANEPEESFHFQTRHLDAFFSYLPPAGISLDTAENTLFDESLQKG